jgi:hypothetical protein
LVIIPEEAELLLPKLRRIQTPMTFLLTYTAPLTRSLLEVGTLAYYPVPTPKKEFAIPSWLSIEIGLMAGRLYLPYHQYTQLRNCLEVDERAYPSLALDEFLRRRKHILPNLGILSIKQLAKFRTEWIAHRSRSSDIMHTPMGYLIQNRDLPENHPFFFSKPRSRAAHEELIKNAKLLGTHDSNDDSDDDSEWSVGGYEVDNPTLAKDNGEER